MTKRAFLPLLALLVLAACTSNRINLEAGPLAPPTRTFDSVAVGEIEPEAILTAPLVIPFREGLLERLREETGISRVVDANRDPVPLDTLVVSGRLTKADPGNAAARIIIGFGAGAQSIDGRFRLEDIDGNALASFASGGSYSGGLGVGGISHLSMEDLARRFGRSVAAAVGRWIRGEPLQPPPEDDRRT